MMDPDSSFSGVAKLQPSTSMNTDSFMRVPASPISFSSNNISGSSVIDGSVVQQSPPQDQVQNRRSSSVTSHPMIEGGALHAQKKSRIDVRQDDIQHELIQQLLHGSSLHLQGQQNPQVQALIQQHKMAQMQQRQQQQLLQPFGHIQQSQIGIPRQPQLRLPLAQPAMQLAGPIRTPVDSGLCSRRLLQYLYHKRHRPENNPITYWRKLVEEYFAPRARERWCVSSYEKRANGSVSTPQTALDSWRCDICNSHGGKGYEGLKNYPKPNLSKVPGQSTHEGKQTMAAAGLPNDQNTTKVMGVKQEIRAHVDSRTSGVGAVGNSAPQNAAALNSYQNILRSSSANQSLLQQEVYSVFKGPAAMHSGIQLEASRSFCGSNQVQLAQFQHSPSLQHPIPQHNNVQGLGIQNNLQGLGVQNNLQNLNPQHQQHVFNQLLQEVKNTNNRTSVQQPPPDNPNVNNGLASRAANTNGAATREQTPHMNNSVVKGAATIGTGPSNVINDSTVSIVSSRSNSFKSVSSNPAVATADNDATSKAEPFPELDDLDSLITNELAESGLFVGDQGGNGFSWNM
ncbi:unnamed protein product [Urochloa decumbens]|uniref:Transcriptional regulator SLK2 n=1 Tax=Urochloa decumbens TaxID=240449 RepID=A0ABC9F2D6_9POAL